jgi:hypothetical protein
MASAHGGRRNGAGRPARADLYRQPIREAEGLIRDKLPFLVGQLLQLAEGVQVEEADRDGNAVVYRTAPDRKACEYLLNRIMGTPVQRNEQGDPGDFVSLDQARKVLHLGAYRDPSHTDAG